MKNTKKIIVTIVLSSLIFGNCSKSILDEIDTNPNNPVDVPIKTLVTSVTTGVPFNITGTDMAWYSSIFVEQTAGVHGQMLSAELRTDGVTSSSHSNSWLYAYPRILKDIEDIQSKSIEENNIKTLGVAQVLESFTYTILTDLFGDIPYSEALKAEEGITAPKYDSQVDVYTGILKVLDAAIENLSKSEGIIGGEDFIFSGDVSKWTKTAYALKARVMNRTIGTGVKKSDGTDISNDDIIEAVSKAFKSNVDNFTYSRYQDAQGWRNPWYQEELDRSHHSISRTFYLLLEGKSDPRLSVSINSSNINTSASDYNVEDLKGKPSGSDVNDQGKKKYPIMSTKVLNPTKEMPMMTYSELKFIEAEALERKATGSGETAFIEGINASFSFFGIADTSAVAVTYVNSRKTAYSGGDGVAKLKSIIEEKYVTLWPFGSIEAYTEYRRTGYPTLSNPYNDQGLFPVRFHYVENEITSNKDNVPTVNIYTSKLIWDKN